MNETINPGCYEHYKGNFYQVLFTANHSETGEIMVVYQALYGERKIWVRPASMWNEMIITGTKTVPRFRFVGDSHEFVEGIHE
jgi:hypothetical protein